MRAVAATLLLAGCATTSSPGVRLEKLGDDLHLLRVSESLWIHISEDKTERWGTVPANGLLVIGEGESLLVDSGWRADQAERLLAFARDQLSAPVRRVIFTHGHGDRIGGASALAKAQVHAIAQARTRAALVEAFPGESLETFDELLMVPIGGRSLEVFYPGAGHSRDNVVVWLAGEKVLFGGCLVKSGQSTELGNREDAVLAEWPLSVLRLLERYKEAELVIPGHGPPAGVGLLRHTLGLLEQDMSIPGNN